MRPAIRRAFSAGLNVICGLKQAETETRNAPERKIRPGKGQKKENRPEDVSKSTLKYVPKASRPCGKQAKEERKGPGLVAERTGPPVCAAHKAARMQKKV